MNVIEYSIIRQKIYINFCVKTVIAKFISLI